MEEFATAFNDADMVYVAPVYAAGSSPIEGVDAAELVGKIKRRGHHGAGEVADAADACPVIAGRSGEAGDMVVCLGAGDITKWAAGLADAIEGGCGDESTAHCSPRVAGQANSPPMRRSRRWSGSNRAAPRNGCSSQRMWLICKPFCARLIRQMPVMALGLGSNMIVRDGGVPGVVVRLGKAFAKVAPVGRYHTELRRRGFGHSRILDRARQGHCGLGIPAFDPRHGRRLCADERWCLWQRGEGYSGRLRCRAAVG